jgi:hypothetical protein
MERLVVRWRTRCSSCRLMIEPGECAAWSPLTRPVVRTDRQLERVGAAQK